MAKEIKIKTEDEEQIEYLRNYKPNWLDKLVDILLRRK